MIGHLTLFCGAHCYADGPGGWHLVPDPRSGWWHHLVDLVVLLLEKLK
jgi:hypothetical protein